VSFSGLQTNAQDEELLKLKKGHPIVVDGDKVEFFEKENKIVAEGNVSITYGDVTLSCDRIEVNMKTQQALCRGNVHIKHPEGDLTGSYILYDFLNKKGEIIGAEVKAFPWFGQAEETKKVAKNEYILRKGFVSTCDLDFPHYRIHGEEIQVFPEDKVIAKNVIFYIGKVPVLWVPYYYHPIIQSRAKVQFIPGRSTDWGYFLLSAWRFYIRGNTKVDVLGDYRTKKGFAEGANLYYYMDDMGFPGLGEGTFRAYFAQQNMGGTYDPSPFQYGDTDTNAKLRKRFQWTHRIDFEPGTVGMLEFNKVSDEYMLKDYFYNEYEENNFIPQNYASIITAKPNYTLGINFEKRFNDFYTVTQKLPELKLEIPSQRLWKTYLYYNSEMSGTVFDKKFAFGQEDDEKVGRFDYFNRLSYVSKLGFLNLTPFVAFRETLYTRNKWEKDFISRGALEFGVDAFSQFYRIYDIKTNALGLDINDLRHIIVPKAEYVHMHQPTVDKDNLFQMDDIDTLEKKNQVYLYLENKLQTKRHIGSELKTVDLVRFIMRTNFFFRMKKDKFEFKKNAEFSGLYFDLEMAPYPWMYIDSKMEVNPKYPRLDTGSLEFSLRPGDKFNMAFGYRYERKHPDPRNQFTFDMDFIFSPKWRFGWYERFNLQQGSIEEQQFSVTRDLHCWEVEFTYSVEGSNFFKDNYEVWLAFKIKAFPDLPIGLSRSFSRRPPGAFNR